MPDPKPSLVLGPVIGGLSHRRVRLWGRASGPAIMRAWLAIQPDLRDSAVFGETELLEETGYGGVIDIYALEPSRQYYYALALDTGARPPASEFRRFQTFPLPGEMQDFRFAFGAGFRPGGPEPGRTFQHMLDNQPALDFLIQQSEQIHADQWTQDKPRNAALALSDYRQVYLQIWANPSYRETLRRTPVFMTPGIPELDSDRFGPDSEHSPQLQAALQAYEEHQGVHAPGLTLPRRSQRGGLRLVESPAAQSRAYTFYDGAVAFFVMDTRLQRAFLGNRKMLGEPQWERLEQWLLAVRDEFPVKFIISSRSVLSDDRTSWASYHEERDRLLFFLAANGISGVYILATSPHGAHAISTELHGPQGRSILIWEFCAAALEQKPSLLAPFLRKKPRSPALHKSKIHYSISKTDYGVVQVSFQGARSPRVTLELHYEDRGKWKMRATETQVK